SMFPASDLSEILTNLSALNLQPNTTAAILAAVLAPLLRSSQSVNGDFQGATASMKKILRLGRTRWRSHSSSIFSDQLSRPCSHWLPQIKDWLKVTALRERPSGDELPFHHSSTNYRSLASASAIARAIGWPVWVSKKLKAGLGLTSKQ